MYICDNNCKSSWPHTQYISLSIHLHYLDYKNIHKSLKIIYTDLYHIQDTEQGWIRTRQIIRIFSR